MTPEKPVVLIHGCNFKETNPGIFRPDLFGCLQLLVAGETLRRGMVNMVVIAGGVVSPGKPPVSEIMREELFRMFPKLEKDHVISTGSARNTLEEITHFKRIAEERGWTKLLLVGPEGQIPRIKRLASENLKGSAFCVRSAESVLTEDIRNEAYRQFIAALRRWRGYRLFALKHKILNTIERLPKGVSVVARASKLLPDKGAAETGFRALW